MNKVFVEVVNFSIQKKRLLPHFNEKDAFKRARCALLLLESIWREKMLRSEAKKSLESYRLTSFQLKPLYFVSSWRKVSFFSNWVEPSEDEFNLNKSHLDLIIFGHWAPQNDRKLCSSDWATKTKKFRVCS